MSISPMTPPGTKVIAIMRGSLSAITVGAEYTVVAIEPYPHVNTKFICQLSEFPDDYWFCLGCFRLPITPNAIASHKNTIDEPKRNPSKVKVYG